MEKLWFVLAASFVSFLGGANVFIEPEGGPMFGLVHVDDCDYVDVHIPVRNKAGDAFEYRGFSDYAIARQPSTGAIYVQRAHWWPNVADDGLVVWEQDVTLTDLWPARRAK